LEHLAPVFLLVAGYMLGGAVIRLAIMRQVPYWFSIGAALEAVFLAIFAVAHHRLAGGSPTYVPDRWTLIGLMACLTLAMGVQNALLNNVREVTVRTTFVTGMIINFANALLDWTFAALTGGNTGEQREKAGIYAAVWASFCSWRLRRRLSSGGLRWDRFLAAVLRNDRAGPVRNSDSRRESQAGGIAT
jgi:uncharacterized membrane protein YoaK (UPF0700 family)